MSDHPPYDANDRPSRRPSDDRVAAARTATAARSRAADPGVRRIPHRAPIRRQLDAERADAGDPRRAARLGRDALPRTTPRRRVRGCASPGLRQLRRSAPAAGGRTPAAEPAAVAVSGAVHQHAAASGQARAVGGLAPVAVSLVGSADQRRREPADDSLQRPHRPGEQAAAWVLPHRDAVVEGRCRQDHHHRHRWARPSPRSAATGWWPWTPTPTAAR